MCPPLTFIITIIILILTVWARHQPSKTLSDRPHIPLSKRESERYYWSQRFSIFSLQRKVWSTWSLVGSGQLFQVHAWMFISFHLSFEFHHCKPDTSTCQDSPNRTGIRAHTYMGIIAALARKMCITAPRLRSVSPALVVGSDPSVHVPVSFPVNWDGSLRCAATDTQTAAGESDTCSFNYNLLLFCILPVKQLCAFPSSLSDCQTPTGWNCSGKRPHHAALLTLSSARAPYLRS